MAPIGLMALYLVLLILSFHTLRPRNRITYSPKETLPRGPIGRVANLDLLVSKFSPPTTHEKKSFIERVECRGGGVGGVFTSEIFLVFNF